MHRPRILVALLVAMPDVRTGATKGADVVPWVLRSALSAPLAVVLLAGTVITQRIPK